MSYNISRAKVKIKDLEIPYAAFFTNSRDDWHPDVEINDPQHPEIITLAVLETSMAGRLDNKIFKVESVDLSGEGSGTAWEWIWQPALKASTGLFEATLIWEGGENIERITCQDGNYHEVRIDL